MLKTRRVMSQLAVVAALACGQSSPAGADSVTALTGFNCMFWTDAHTDEAKMPHAMMDGYVLGYLSARAMLLGIDHLKDVAILAVLEEVSRQCKFKPSANLADISLIVARKFEEQ